MGVGQGRLDPTEKYVVLLEFYGPAELTATRQLKGALDKLMKRYKGRWKENVSADKRKGDPKQGWARKPRRRGKKRGGR
jgi:hypothetical protein